MILKAVIRHVRGNAVAYVALFLALSGTAVAAKPLITGADIQDDSVTGADVQESSLGKVGPQTRSTASRPRPSRARLPAKPVRPASL